LRRGLAISVLGSFDCQLIYLIQVIKRQITKSGTSIGANYREANRARSKADFKNKIRICEGETSETQYWLEMIVEVGWLSKEEVKFELKECGELLAIFTSINKKYWKEL